MNWNKKIDNFREVTLLVDGMCLLYRSFYAYPFLKTKSGISSGAIYGFINFIRSLISMYKPNYTILVFDYNGKTFRNKLYKKYKSNRSKMPKELFNQIDPLKKIVQAMGLSILSFPDVEADDVIGTLAKKISEKKNHLVLISSLDKDMAQLVSRNIFLLDLKKNKLLDPIDIFNKFGVYPELIVDLISLMGDYSDNIPGVPGIGKRIALVLLNKIGSLKEIYNNLSNISNIKLRGAKKIQEKLVFHKKDLDLFYRLVTLKTDLNLKIDFEEFKIKDELREDLYNLFVFYEFKKWIIYLKNGIWNI